MLPTTTNTNLGGGLDEDTEVSDDLLGPLWATDFIDVTSHDGRVIALGYDKVAQAFILAIPRIDEVGDPLAWATERIVLPFKQVNEPSLNLEQLGTYYNYTALAVDAESGRLHVFGKTDEASGSMPLHLSVPLPGG